MNMLAEKFKFQPEYIPERAYDVVKENGTLYGMLHRVRLKDICMERGGLGMGHLKTFFIY